SQPIDPMLKLFSEISGMSPDRRVQHYLHVLLVRKETRLRFQLVGNLVMAQEAIRFPNGIVLETQQTRRKLTRRISQMSADEIRQQITERVYVIDGSVDSDVWKTGQIAERVTGIVEQIERTVILLSFLCGAKLGWAPAQLALDRNGSSVLAPVPIKSRDYVHADEAHVGSLVALSRLVENLSPRVRVDVYRAMDWYQQGVKSASPFNSFLSFWSAIETTARSLHPKLRDKSGKTQIIHAFASAFDREARPASREQGELHPHTERHCPWQHIRS
ncbi:MAG: hypothetical protein HW414_1492, partial [Dehalococcoidia bacterium]|nr:hypothetical protein [Dehalococcoidia bacterium]